MRSDVPAGTACVLPACDPQVFADKSGYAGRPNQVVFPVVNVDMPAGPAPGGDELHP